MAVKPIELLGGESVYCINRSQLESARRLAEGDPVAAPRIQEAIRDLEERLSRNERAALAFVVIDRLLKSSAP
jgi:hypothetical protein